MYIYKTKGVCSSEINIEISGDKIQSVKFINGCPGNTFGVSELVKGLSVDEVITKLKGINCRGRGTSCPDQLTRALESYKQSN